MKPLRRIVVLSLLLLVCASCGRYDQKIVIKDVTKAQTIEVHKKPGQGHIYSMGIRVSGQIDGNAKVTLVLDGAPYKVANMEDKSNFSWGGDWYADSIELHYEPNNVRSGKLTIEYYFSDIQ